MRGNFILWKGPGSEAWRPERKRSPPEDQLNKRLHFRDSPGEAQQGPRELFTLPQVLLALFQLFLQVWQEEPPQQKLSIAPQPQLLAVQPEQVHAPPPGACPAPRRRPRPQVQPPPPGVGPAPRRRPRLQAQGPPPRSPPESVAQPCPRSPLVWRCTGRDGKTTQQPRSFFRLRWRGCVWGP